MAARKTSAPSVVRAPAKSAAKAASAKTKAASAPVNKTVAAQAVKVKHKLVRDSFTIPKDEYAVLGELKLRAGLLMTPAKKSEILRAGINALRHMPDEAFVSAMAAVPSLKTGRPKKDAKTPSTPISKKR